MFPRSPMLRVPGGKPSSVLLLAFQQLRQAQHHHGDVRLLRRLHGLGKPILIVTDEIATARVIDLCFRRDQSANTRQHRDGRSRCAHVVAGQHQRFSGVRTDDGNRLEFSFIQRQLLILVLQQNQRLARRFQRQVTMLGRIHHAVGNLGISHLLVGIEHAQAEARHKQTLHRSIQIGFGQQSLGHGLTQLPVITRDAVRAAAFQITAVFHGQRSRLGR